MEHLIQFLFKFQEEYCEIVTFDCPTRADFDGYDDNQDGVLTMAEYQAHLDAKKDD